jgi:hypothetical protein
MAFPTVIQFEDLKLFQERYLYDEKGSWSWKLGESALHLGYTAFNDSPEIGTFLAMLKRDYQIDTAIETGTFFGATTLFFSRHFDTVHTIEAAKPIYDKVKQDLAPYPNIHCHFGGSEKVLETLLPQLRDKRLLFYLDAHAYSGDADKGGYEDWPILAELEEIRKTHADNCIIVIDDFQVPDTDLHGCVDRTGMRELSHPIIREKLNAIFSGYTFHYLIPTNRTRAAKFVAIPKKWQGEPFLGRVDILSGFSIYDFPVTFETIKKAGYEMQMHYQYPYKDDEALHDKNIQKIVIFGGTLSEETFSHLPKEKIFFFNMEPIPMSPEYHAHFARVYTTDDDLVDNQTFFKLPYPYLMPMRTSRPPFEAKRLCVMVSGSDNDYPERKNELYSERMKMVEFFETKPAGELDIYGRFWVKRHYRDFKGHIPGDHSGEQKISTLSNYRFSICFENTKNVNGYITEKIFACFAAGCVPVYWGASNITDYIPKNCFIDYRDFSSPEELYQFIKNMSKETYEQYLHDIRTFLSSEKAQVFSPATFEKILLDAISS